MTAPQPESPGPAQDTCALEVAGVVAGYGGGDVLRGVSIQVMHGGITCVVGPNGAGKSTLLATISGLLRPRLGEITLHGERLTGKTPRQILRTGVVQVPQNHSLFREMTVRENISLGGYILRERGLAERRFAGVLEMLDEPSMGLAPKVLKLVFDAIRMMHAQGKTILLVEQNARAGLRLSTHGVVLENGQVRLSGSGKEVLEHPEIGALYLGGAVTPGGAVPPGGAVAAGGGVSPGGAVNGPGENGSGAAGGTAYRAGH